MGPLPVTWLPHSLGSRINAELGWGAEGEALQSLTWEFRALLLCTLWTAVVPELFRAHSEGAGTPSLSKRVLRWWVG